MNVTRKPIRGRDNKPIISKSALNYPQSSPDLPRQYFVAAAVGSRGSGKSFSVAKLISLYEQSGLRKDGRPVPLRTILICPSATTNAQFAALRSLDPRDVHMEYSPELVRDILDDVAEQRRLAERYQKRLALWERVGLTSRPSDFSPHERAELTAMGWRPPVPEGRYEVPPSVVLILDDLMGSSAFSNAPRNVITNLTIKNRHLGINVIFCVQALRQLPKVIRANVSLWMLYSYKCKSLLNDLYDEVSGVLTRDAFETVYNEVTSQPYRFLVIDTTVSPTRLKDAFEYDISM